MKKAEEMIDPVVMCDYLRDNGWDERKITRNDIRIFHHQDDDGSVSRLVVPMTKELSDYNSAMRLAIRKIVEASGRDVGDILTDLLNLPSDAILVQYF